MANTCSGVTQMESTCQACTELAVTGTVEDVVELVVANTRMPACTVGVVMVLVMATRPPCQYASRKVLSTNTRTCNTHTRTHVSLPTTLWWSPRNTYINGVVRWKQLQRVCGAARGHNARVTDAGGAGRVAGVVAKACVLLAA